MEEVKKIPVLVIGSGIAGLFYALQLAEKVPVLVICKDDPLESNSNYAQGGVATVTDSDDSFDSHFQDTISVGVGLCHEDIVKLVVSEGPSVINELLTYGANFDQSKDSVGFELGREAGHSQRRILHWKDQTGAEIMRALYETARKNPNITIRSNCIAIDLITTSEKEVLGAHILDKNTSDIFTVNASVTLIATGGVGKVYLYTSNPDVATGDGIAMAYRAGAEIANMEFIQFHPTCLYHPEAKNFLITEALRGEGALLKTPDGKEFMSEYSKDLELAPRDIIARAIDDQMKKHGFDYVLLDMSHLDAAFLKNRFPNIYERLLTFGYDITKEPIPIVPAAHYCCGGIVVDSYGQSTLPRLFAAGEASCTGLHGANRLASNSLLEAMVFAKRAAIQTEKLLSSLPPPTAIMHWDHLDTERSSEQVIVTHSWDEVRRLMWNLVGIVRSNKRLKLAKKKLQSISQEIQDYYWNYRVTSDLIELRNIIDVAHIIVESAILRKESRGLHFTSDYPTTDDVNWKKDTVLKKEHA